MSKKSVSLIAGAMLLLAIPVGLPYGYYELLRLVISICGAFIAWKFYESKQISLTLTFAAITFLFNPIAPIYLSKSTWVPIDFISALLFFWAGYSESKKSN